MIMNWIVAYGERCLWEEKMAGGRALCGWPQGVEGYNMMGPSEALGSPWPPLVLRPWRGIRAKPEELKRF